MAALKNPIEVQTAFDQYRLAEVIGEGGAGRVYGGTNSDGASVAIKALTNASRDHLKRFKNEIAFLMRKAHRNLIAVSDYGIGSFGSESFPFYVMPRYSGSLRSVITRWPSSEVTMKYFAQVLDGVEAAHLMNVVHRDLKPENVLFDEASGNCVIADFGIARFCEDSLATSVNTGPGSRLANFQYAAPEQRTKGGQITRAADIYALGLMLNEFFTGVVPQGTDHKLVAHTAPEWAFLDEVIAKMMRQNPHDRPATIADVKALIQAHRGEFITSQKLKRHDQTVVPVSEIEDPLAFDPPKIVGVEYDHGQLQISLDRKVSDGWANALRNLGSFTSVSGIPPSSFRFVEDVAIVTTAEHSAQQVIDYFKSWLGPTTANYRHRLENEAREQERRRVDELRRQREQLEAKLRINKSLKF
jgi:serine/threonine protein kinase